MAGDYPRRGEPGRQDVRFTGSTSVSTLAGICRHDRRQRVDCGAGHGAYGARPDGLLHMVCRGRVYVTGPKLGALARDNMGLVRVDPYLAHDRIRVDLVYEANKLCCDAVFSMLAAGTRILFAGRVRCIAPPSVSLK